MSSKKGKVILIGAGPGDKGLLTLKGYDYLKKADVVVYDRLVSQDVLDLSPEKAELINVGKVMNHHNIPQDEINKILLDKALEGKNVVRLKGGDPFVFGRGGEELELLNQNNIDFEVIPGITSAVSALAYSGIPVTHRDFSSSIHFVTGHAKDGLVENIDFKSLVDSKGTILFYMGVSTLSQLVDGLIKAGMDINMPCGAVENGTRSNMRTLVSTLGSIVKDAEEFNLKSPAIIVVGKVCLLADKFAWFTKNNIFSRKIIALRHYNSDRILYDKLKNFGADVIDYPCLKAEKIENNTKLQELIKNISNYSNLVFTSKYSVEAFFNEFEKEGYDTRKLYGLKIYAVGRITKDELKKYGINPDYILKDYLFENILEEISLEIKNGLTAVLESDDSNKSLSRLLEDKGCKVSFIPAYKLNYLDFKNNQPIDYYIENGAVFAFTSSSVVEGLVLGSKPKNISKIKGVCIGNQTYNKALSYNMNVVMAEKPSIESLIEKIKDMEK